MSLIKLGESSIYELVTESLTKNDKIWVGLESTQPYTGDFRDWKWQEDDSSISYR